MKKPQWITVGAAIVLVAGIYLFGRTTPLKQKSSSNANQLNLTDTILNMAKSRLSPEQALRLTTLENSISRGDVKEQQLRVYHQLAHFWGDSAGFFLPYAWYEAEAARLENSEKSLTFAARLFLENLQQEHDAGIRRWEAIQARDLFERSLRINPDNDSSKIGLGAVYLFGNISDMPMEGINRIRQVLDNDSTNVYAQMMLIKGSMMSEQYDKAIGRLHTVIRIQPENAEAILMLADAYERTNDKANAIKWYERSLQLIQRKDIKAVIEKRVEELKK